jgi:hypothetical protein
VIVGSIFTDRGRNEAPRRRAAPTPTRGAAPSLKSEQSDATLDRFETVFKTFNALLA